jgi:isocitrate dehydrogenase
MGKYYEILLCRNIMGDCVLDAAGSGFGSVTDTPEDGNATSYGSYKFEDFLSS